MRCRICGRPIGATESLKASERPCAGCEDDFKALKSEVEILFEPMVPEGETEAVLVEVGERPVRTTLQAFGEAKTRHQEREKAYYEAAVKIMRQRVAAGFSAVDGVTPLQGTSQEVARAKAAAFAALEADTNKEAQEADFVASLEGDPK